jgi:two-component system, sensor histidine kinase and response regulator
MSIEKTRDVILVIDDQPSNLKVIASILSREYSVSLSNSGANALKNLNRICPDLILLDIMMPDMDGFEVCRQIKEKDDFKEIPVIFFSAKTDMEDIIKGFSYGAVDYVTKPFNPKELKIRIKNHLNLRHALQINQQLSEKLNDFDNRLHNTNGIIDQLTINLREIYSSLWLEMKTPLNDIIRINDMVKQEAQQSGLTQIHHSATLIKESALQAINILELVLKQRGIKSEKQIGKR